MLMRLKDCKNKVVHYDGRIYHVVDDQGQMQLISGNQHTYFSGGSCIRLSCEAVVKEEGGYLHVDVKRLKQLRVNSIFIWNQKLWSIGSIRHNLDTRESDVTARCIGKWSTDHWTVASGTQIFDGNMILEERNGFHYAT